MWWRLCLNLLSKLFKALQITRSSDGKVLTIRNKWVARYLSLSYCSITSDGGWHPMWEWNALKTNQSYLYTIIFGIHLQKTFSSGRNGCVRVDALRQSRQRHPGGGLLRGRHQYHSSHCISPCDCSFTVSSRSASLLLKWTLWRCGQLWPYVGIGSLGTLLHRDCNAMRDAAKISPHVPSTLSARSVGRSEDMILPGREDPHNVGKSEWDQKWGKIECVFSLYDKMWWKWDAAYLPWGLPNIYSASLIPPPSPLYLRTATITPQ